MSAIISTSSLPYYEPGTETEETKKEEHEDEDSHPHFEDEGGKSNLPTFLEDIVSSPGKIIFFAVASVALILLVKKISGTKKKHKTGVFA